MKKHLFMLIALCVGAGTFAQTKLVPVARGWTNNSVNATVFRKNSVVSRYPIQMIAYYNPEGYMCLAKRTLGETAWIVLQTPYKGNVNDAHNSISIMLDGKGYLHVSWDHHGNALRYAVSKEPYSLELGEKIPMTGLRETDVTYPEFYNMPNGDLLFLYRDGESGKGNLVLNRYELASATWTQVQQNLISGEGKRNAYWQACVDDKGVIHLSWVWRETPDVASNHNLCYARSLDGGVSWIKSTGEPYGLPITADNAEYACHIPQNSELINQTSMSSDAEGNPYIATYWRKQSSDVPQYHVVYHDGRAWRDAELAFRSTPFSLKGAGTKRIPISRPQVIAQKDKHRLRLALLFRDAEREDRVSIAICKNIRSNKWRVKDLTDFSVGAWEPTFDTELWRTRGLLHVFIQPVEQVDGEGKADVPPQLVQVLETKID